MKTVKSKEYTYLCSFADFVAGSLFLDRDLVDVIRSGYRDEWNLLLLSLSLGVAAGKKGKCHCQCMRRTLGKNNYSYLRFDW